MAKQTRKLIIHAGMHKTGSTAIQHWLRKHKQPTAHYFDWREPNHSTLFVLMFQEKPHEFFALAKAGYTEEQAMEERVVLKDDVRRQIVQSDKDTFVFSAERISTASDEAVQNMCDFFRPLFSDIQVYCYVRRPSGFATSMFQQHLKTGEVKLVFRKLWPFYRERFERLYSIFGEQNVHLRSFDKLGESGRDSVGDFLEWTGINSAPHTEFLRNKSMSATGMSLLYFYRRLIEPEVPPGSKVAYDTALLDLIRHLPGERFHIDLTRGRPLQQHYVEDARWISERVGENVNDVGGSPEGVLVFRRGLDIIHYAIGQTHLLDPSKSEDRLDPSVGENLAIAAERYGAVLSHRFGWRTRWRLRWTGFWLARRPPQIASEPHDDADGN